MTATILRFRRTRMAIACRFCDMEVSLVCHDRGGIRQAWHRVQMRYGPTLQYCPRWSS